MDRVDREFGFEGAKTASRKVVHVGNADALHRDGGSFALVVGEIDEETLEEAASKVADPVLVHPGDQKLQFLNVPEAVLAVLLDVLE